MTFFFSAFRQEKIRAALISLVLNAFDKLATGVTGGILDFDATLDRLVTDEITGMTEELLTSPKNSLHMIQLYMVDGVLVELLSCLQDCIKNPIQKTQLLSIFLKYNFNREKNLYF